MSPVGPAKGHLPARLTIASQWDRFAFKVAWMATRGPIGNPRQGAVSLPSGSASIKTGKSPSLLSQSLGRVEEE